MTTVAQYIAELPPGLHITTRALRRRIKSDLGVEITSQELYKRYIEKAPNMIEFSYRSVGKVYEVVPCATQ